MNPFVALDPLKTSKYEAGGLKAVARYLKRRRSLRANERDHLCTHQAMPFLRRKSVVLRALFPKSVVQRFSDLRGFQGFIRT